MLLVITGYYLRKLGQFRCAIIMKYKNCWKKYTYIYVCMCVCVCVCVVCVVGYVTFVLLQGQSYFIIVI